MKHDNYNKAVTAFAIKDLAVFNTEHGFTIEGWAKLSAPDKRGAFFTALESDMDMRRKFVEFYNASHEEGCKPWSEWENLPTDPSTEVATLPVIGQFVDDAFSTMVADVAGLDAVASSAALLAAEESLEFEHMRVGVLLSHMQSGEHYLTLGYNNLREYLAAETTVGYRVAVYLINNANAVRDLGIAPESLKGITWTALRHILPILTEANYGLWLDAARSMKQVGLIEAVKAEQEQQPTTSATGTVADPAQMTQKTFVISKAEKSAIDAAIEKAKVEGNTDNTGKALGVMAAAYTGQPAQTYVGGVSDDALKTSFEAVAKDEGTEGLIRILNIVGAVWPEAEINCEIGKPPEVSDTPPAKVTKASKDKAAKTA